MRIPPNYGPTYTREFHALFSELADAVTSVPLVPFLLDGVALDDALMQADGIHPNAAAQPRLLAQVWPQLEPLLTHDGTRASGTGVPAMNDTDVLARPWLDVATRPACRRRSIRTNIRSLTGLLEQSWRALSRLGPRTRAWAARSRTRELDRSSADSAAWLQQARQAASKGDRVAIMLPNVLQYPIALVGALRAGLTVVNTNPLYTPRELEHQLADSGARAIVILENFAHTLEEVIDDTRLEHVIVTGVGDLLGLPEVARSSNFVVRHVRKQVPALSLPGAVRFNEALQQGRYENLVAGRRSGPRTSPSCSTRAAPRASPRARCSRTATWSRTCCRPRRGSRRHSSARTTRPIVTALPLYHIFALTANCWCS